MSSTGKMSTTWRSAKTPSLSNTFNAGTILRRDTWPQPIRTTSLTISALLMGRLDARCADSDRSQRPGQHHERVSLACSGIGVPSGAVRGCLTMVYTRSWLWPRTGSGRTWRCNRHLGRLPSGGRLADAHLLANIYGSPAARVWRSEMRGSSPLPATACGREEPPVTSLLQHRLTP